MCSLKTRYHMRFDRLTHAIGKMICVVKNKTLKHLDTKLAVRYGHSTVAHEPIRSVVRVVMAHRNLARQRYQKWTSPLVARIPMALPACPFRGECQIVAFYISDSISDSFWNFCWFRWLLRNKNLNICSIIRTFHINTELRF